MGFVADFVGAWLMFIQWIFDLNFWIAIRNPFLNIYGFICITIYFTVTAVLIYIVNRKICLKKLPLSDAQKHKIALSLAVFTAPYLFYLPAVW